MTMSMPIMNSLAKAEISNAKPDREGPFEIIRVQTNGTVTVRKDRDWEASQHSPMHSVLREVGLITRRKRPVQPFGRRVQ